MPAYLIAQLHIHDPQTYQRYATRAPAVIARYGGRILARGPVTEVLEGHSPGVRVVIIEFPSVEAARTFHGSAEYQQLRKIREAVSEAHVVLVDGRQEPPSN